tara:strand:- start:1723 stop:2454 length:732 start_codon:yes stop_codon:yes gene_type:complete
MIGLGANLTGGADIIPEWVTPADFGDSLLLWLRHDTGLQESDGSTPEDGEDITQWTDKSSHARHATASSNYPDYIATGGYVDFTGTSEALRLAGDALELTTFSCYVRLTYNNDTLNSQDILLDDPDTSSNFWRIQSSTQIRVRLSAGGSKNFTPHTELTDATMYNMGIERDGYGNLSSWMAVGGGAIAQNGSTLVQGLSKTFNVDRIKGGNECRVSEIIIVNRALSSLERTLLDAWLKTETAG